MTDATKLAIEALEEAEIRTKNGDPLQSLIYAALAAISHPLPTSS